MEMMKQGNRGREIKHNTFFFEKKKDEIPPTVRMQVFVLMPFYPK